MKVCRGSYTRSWNHLTCSAWRGDWGQSSASCTASSWREEEGPVLVSSLWWSVTGLKGMAWDSISGGLGWMLRKSSILKAWLRTGMGSPWKWSQLQSESSRSVCAMLSDTMCVSWGGHVQTQELDFDDPCRPLTTQNILWFYDLNSCILQQQNKCKAEAKRKEFTVHREVRTHLLDTVR